MTPSDNEDLSRHLLRELSSLNYRFIKLLTETKDDPCQYGLSDQLHRRLCNLNEEDRRRLASCPYSLFELKLDDTTTWQQWLNAEVQLSPAPSAIHTFTLAVLMYTQQLAVENTDLGRLLLGLTPRVAEQFRRSTIGRLMDSTPLVSENLQVRLIDDPHFWPDLVNYVRDGTNEQYLAAQTSALQILAAQL